MRKLLARLTLVALVAPALGCQPSGHEVVVTRDQLGEAWPLQVNSAKVLCSGDATYVRVGRRLYGVSPEADAPPVSEIARQIPVDPRQPELGAWPADTAPLLEVCEGVPGDVASR